MKNYNNWSPRRRYLHEIIFEAETKAGKMFDVALLLLILCSVIVVMLETVPSYHLKYGELFAILEWAFTIVFLIEYCLRIYCVYDAKRYIFSFYGIIDLLSILPAFASLFLAGSRSLMIIRGLRLLRVFRIFKLAQFLTQGQIIIDSLKASRAKISVFMIFILIVVSIFGSLMYLIEGQANSGFDSIPRSIYWAIVTLTTVGYGDISPATPLGQLVASVIMIAGYSILAVPTGIITSEVLSRSNALKLDIGENHTVACPTCMLEGHLSDAKFCRRCGSKL